MATAAPERLLSLEEALGRMLAGLQVLPEERVPLADSVGRVLAAPIVSRLALPPWDNSAMDGFAVRASDVADATADQPVTLRVIGEIAAGHEPTQDVTPGTTLRILTGAVVPRGADAVVPVELTNAERGMAELPAEVAVHRGVSTGESIRRVGSDVRAGDEVLSAGTSIDAASLALLAATGWNSVAVTVRPRVAILSTGDELVPVGSRLGPGQIYDSNSPAVAAHVYAAGGEPIALGTARDSLAEVVAALTPALATVDAIVVTGGVSVGARDVVKEAFAEIGQVDLWRVAVQPGKPLAFGRAPRTRGEGEVLLFGLPGNPVSSFVTFELFVRPVIRALLGRRDPLERRRRYARLAQPVQKSPGRRAFLRVKLEPDPDRPAGSLARLAGGQGSHVLSALAHADGLAVVPEDRDELPAGAEVEVWDLDRDVP
jgi:molybdopterin molybdotransferase